MIGGCTVRLILSGLPPLAPPLLCLFLVVSIHFLDLIWVLILGIQQNRVAHSQVVHLRKCFLLRDPIRCPFPIRPYTLPRYGKLGLR